MTTIAARVRDEALKLTPEERAELAAELLATLAPDVQDGRSDADWVREVERRARAAMAGSPGLSWPEAQSRIRDQLARR